MIGTPCGGGRWQFKSGFGDGIWGGYKCGRSEVVPIPNVYMGSFVNKLGEIMGM